MRLPSPKISSCTLSASTPTPAPPAASPSASASQQLLAVVSAVSILGSSVLNPLPALAEVDGAAVGMCLIQKAPVELARCVLDPVCAANLLCIQTCAGRPDEATCQIACGDKFADPAVEDFTRAAVSDKKCVPQRADDGSWPVPMSSALVDKFVTTDIEGAWYISAGLNPAFDIFDCQLHKFEAPTPTTLVGNLQWRVKDPIAGTNFVTRYTVQTFNQDETEPGILYNHDNEFLHYQDDWYILAHKRNAYFVVYYRGSNDAWDGYGGAVVYTRDPVLPKQYVPEIKQAVKAVGLNWDDFQYTDNTCRAAESRLEELEYDLRFVETKVAGGLQLVSEEIKKEALILEKELEKDVVKLEKEIEKDVVMLEKEIEKDVEAIEKEVERDFLGLFRRR